MRTSWENVPEELKLLRRWCCWGLPGEVQKRPFQPDGTAASPADPKLWASFEEAAAAVEAGTARGVGFCLDPADGLVCVDLDHSIDDSGQLTPWAAAWVQRLDSYTEVSPSGHGLHIWARGQIARNCKRPTAELYSRARFMTVTGNVCGEVRPIREAQAEIDALAAELDPPQSAAADLGELEHLTGDELRARLEDAFRQDGDLAELWGSEDHTGDESARDFALLKCLSRALHCDADSLVEAFSASPWCESKDPSHAAKWARTDYQQRTAEAAIQAAADAHAAMLDGFTVEGPAADRTPAAFSARQLMTETLPPVRWAVEGLLPAGLAMICAAPKTGKSWLCLALCLEVAAGGQWLGHRCVKGPALYLALEDSRNRLQNRLKALTLDTPGAVPEGLEFMLEAPDADHGLRRVLDGWLEQHPGARLIVVDTLQRIRPPVDGRANAYAADYALCAGLQHWAIARGVCLLLVHHTRKGGDNGDVFSKINGSTGIFGALDSVLALTKKARYSDDAVLSVTGRDVDAVELLVHFDKLTYRWELDGEAAQAAKDEKLAAFLQNPIVSTLGWLLSSDKEWSGSTTALAEKVEQFASVEIMPRSLGRQLNALNTPLRDVLGIEHTITRKAAERIHTFRRTKDMKNPRP